jgi:nitric oxide reductase subunit B
LAFFGAYATINIAFFYLAIQHWRGDVWMSGNAQNAWRWKWALGLLNVGVVGMTIALLIAGYEQSFIERAVEGSTWSGYFSAQNHPSFQSAMVWRWFFGLMTFAGLILLIWDLLTIGKGETRKMTIVVAE